LTQRRIDKERIERADREAKLIEAETLARNAKTARLRALRLSSAQPTERSTPVKTRRPRSLCQLCPAAGRTVL